LGAIQHHKNKGINMSIYIAEGYKSRRDYLETLADEMGIEKEIVFTLASVLGPSEDFDGLVTELEDLQAIGEI
jgi:hypothetical protein